jgi:hypothetical protein
MDGIRVLVPGIRDSFKLFEVPGTLYHLTSLYVNDQLSPVNCKQLQDSVNIP